LEVEKQLLAFEDLFGMPPFRVDGHQHVHVLPGVREVLSRLLPRHGVRWIRIPEEALLVSGMPDHELAGLVDQSALKFYREVSDQASAARPIFQAAGLRCTDAFVGMLTMGRNLTANSLKRSLTAILKLHQLGGEASPTIELMTHPGYPLKEADPVNQGCAAQLGPDDFSRSLDRAHEMAMLQSREFGEVVRAFSGQLYGFGDLA
uniref:Carbohydrate deacetylase n=1 Tax=Schistocephalus solidus TaxID=70667 RepID=A0A183TBX6_SCHSO